MRPRQAFSFKFLVLFLLFAAAFALTMVICTAPFGSSIGDWIVPYLIGVGIVFLLAVFTPNFCDDPW